MQTYTTASFPLAFDAPEAVSVHLPVNDMPDFFVSAVLGQRREEARASRAVNRRSLPRRDGRGPYPGPADGAPAAARPARRVRFPGPTDVAKTRVTMDAATQAHLLAAPSRPRIQHTDAGSSRRAKLPGFEALLRGAAGWGDEE